jgi:small GTP-binding protein
MSKKIVFIGPPGVGKTTLRKIFFEYQSAEQLMQFALDPTYGAESIVINLGQPIGIFDLAGQENYKWLDTAEMEIFVDTTYIIAVVDVTASIDSIADFTSRIVKVRDKVCPRATIFLLAHKIDLLTNDVLDEKKITLYNRLKQVKLIKIEFTSILRAHFLRTLKIFKSIINATLGDEIPLESVDTDLIKDYLAVLSHFKGSQTHSFENLLASSGLPPKRLEEIIGSLTERKLVDTVEENGIAIGSKLALNKDQDFFSLLGSFSREKLDLVEHGLGAGKDNETARELPPFIGFIIADLNGRTIHVVECQEDILKQSLGMEDAKNIDLIPPFVSALTSFSKEIHIVNMADFKIKGQNAIMYVFEHDQYDFIMFLNPDTNIDLFKAEIQNFFIKLVKKYSVELQAALNTGNVTHLSRMRIDAKDWLLHLDENYLLNAKDDQFFDMTRAQQVYTMLEEINPGTGKRKAAIKTEVQLLKRRLVTAIMEKDPREIKEIARIIQKFAS